MGGEGLQNKVLCKKWSITVVLNLKLNTVKPRFWNTFTTDRNFYHLDFEYFFSRFFPKMLIFAPFFEEIFFLLGNNSFWHKNNIKQLPRTFFINSSQNGDLNIGINLNFGIRLLLTNWFSKIEVLLYLKSERTIVQLVHKGGEG